jgi:hypothetical protein
VLAFGISARLSMRGGNVLSEVELAEFRHRVSTAHQRRTFKHPVHWMR